jgi:hypothetical protein
MKEYTGNHQTWLLFDRHDGNLLRIVEGVPEAVKEQTIMVMLAYHDLWPWPAGLDDYDLVTTDHGAFLGLITADLAPAWLRGQITPAGPTLPQPRKIAWSELWQPDQKGTTKWQWKQKRNGKTEKRESKGRATKKRQVPDLRP